MMMYKEEEIWSHFRLLESQKVSAERHAGELERTVIKLRVALSEPNPLTSD